MCFTRSEASKTNLKTSTCTIPRKEEALALAQLKIRQLKVRQRLHEEEQEIQRKRELMEAEMEAEKAEVSLQIYEEEVGEGRRDIDLVISHDEENWQPPKSQGVADPGSTSGPLQWIELPLSNHKSLPFHHCPRLII